MRLVIQDDKEQVGELVADYVIKRINDFGHVLATTHIFRFG